MQKYMFALLSGLFLLNACSNEPATTTDPATSAPTTKPAATPTESVASSVTTVPSAKVRVLAAVYPPFVIRDENGSVTGFDIDILKEIASLEGLNLEIYHQAVWDGALSKLDQETHDLVVAAVTLTSERAEKYLPTKPYVESSNAILVLANSDIKQEADLKGKTVGVSQGAAFLKEKENDPSYANVKFQAFDTPYLALKSVLSKETDAVVGQKLYLQYSLKDSNSTNVRFIDLKTTNSGKVMMSRKGNEELVNKINSGLDKIKQNGSYDRIYNKWFGTAAQ